MNSASEPDLEGLVDALSTERFERYRAAGSGDNAKALALYEWNLRLCGAFYVPLHTVEIGFRNSCHKALTHHFGANWPHDMKFRSVDAHYARQIDKAIAASNAHNATPPVPKIVASLDFGFWTSLLQPKLTDTVWNPALSNAFPRYAAVNGKVIERQIAAETFRDIRHFRNRVFHYEPIFARRSLDEDLERLLSAVSWISIDLYLWMR